jgi:membrane protein implicated in regulation of membrane protease activity
MTFFEFSTSPLTGIYFLCSVFGGTLMVLQFFLVLLGFGGGDEGGDFGDTVEHASPADIFKVLSLRTIIAGITFFGLGGLAGLTGGISKPISVVIAFFAGLAAVYGVYYLYWAAARLKDDGSLSDKTLVGATGNVYVRIPPAKSGVGKVLVSQQGRTVEYEAITAGEELKTSTPITVIRIISTTTVEVAPQ